MRPTVRMIGGLLAAITLAAATATYAAPQAERELLGVRLWRDHASVLKKHGMPTRIVDGVAFAPVQQTQSTQVGLTGGPRMSGMGGMAGMAAMSPAGPGMTGPPSLARRGGAAGRGPGMPASGGLSGPAQFGLGGGSMGEDNLTGGLSNSMDMMSAMMGRSASLGTPGMPSLPTMAGTPGAGGGVGVTVGGSTQMGAADPEVRETWVYERGSHTFQFLFNKDGRVIRIQSFGAKGAGATARRIALGDEATKVYQAYGWPGRTNSDGSGVTLDYSQKAHVLFDMQRSGKTLKVRGITIAASEIGG